MLDNGLTAVVERMDSVNGPRLSEGKSAVEERMDLVCEPQLSVDTSESVGKILLALVELYGYELVLAAVE